jgi:hypothetical protein
MRRAPAVGPSCAITWQVVRCFASAKSVARDAVTYGSAANAVACRGGAGGASAVYRPSLAPAPSGSRALAELAAKHLQDTASGPRSPAATGIPALASAWTNMGHMPGSKLMPHAQAPHTPARRVARRLADHLQSFAALPSGRYRSARAVRAVRSPPPPRSRPGTRHQSAPPPAAACWPAGSRRSSGHAPR